MANLSTLLTARVGSAFRGIEELRGGQIFYFTGIGNNQQICSNYFCNYCWKSPGTGTAVIELWGAAGSSGFMCCCGTGGLPGNAPAYSRKSVSVNSSAYVCGWIGCSIMPTNALCWVGQSGCSVACLYNISTSNCLMRSQGGGGGFIYCTSTAPYCCFAANSYCNTLCSACCGIICNIGGPNGVTTACACGGDVNINGAISCVEFLTGHCNYYPDATLYTHAIAAGIFSTQQSCLRYTGSTNELSPGGFTSSNAWPLMQQLAGMSGSMGAGNFVKCWSSYNDCACYESQSCSPLNPGVPGTAGFVCGGLRTYPLRGGNGAIRITFYS